MLRVFRSTDRSHLCSPHCHHVRTRRCFVRKPYLQIERSRQHSMSIELMSRTMISYPMPAEVLVVRL